jgi:flavodoxin
MLALVVYESLWGNTEQVARAIASGLSRNLDVSVVAVGQAPATIPDDVGLTVIGGPTHAFGLSRPQTRQDALSRGATQGDPSVGVREWLGRQHADGHAGPVATFDTRIDKVRRLPGSAARGAARLARREGFQVASEPESFYVTDTTGPLVAGELDRAKEWGAQLGLDIVAHSTRPAR